MKLSEAEVRKWVQIYSDDIMHFNEGDKEYVTRLACGLDAEILPEDSGVIGYYVYKDFDCKKKLNVVILYCRPEKRGQYIRYMFRRIEEIAKQEGASDIIIGASDSGYKEARFNKVVQSFGYKESASFIKRI